MLPTPLKKLQEWLGHLWGQATTQILAASAFSMALMADKDTGPFLLATFPFLPKVVAAIAIAAAFVRWYAPPPPAVPIERDDHVDADHNTGVVTIVKGSSPLPVAVQSKEAGEPAA